MAAFINMTEPSRRLCGELTVIEFSHFDRFKVAHWRCVCSCGNCVTVDGGNLRRSHTTSCGHVQRQKAAEGNRRRAAHKRVVKAAFKNTAYARESK
jgi:hypothetical protein